MRYRVEDLRYEEVNVAGYRVFFTNERTDSDTVPDGWHQYEVRHDDECLGIPVEISKKILVNFWGTILTREEIRDIENGGKIYLGLGEWTVMGEKSCSWEECMKEGELEHMMVPK